MHSRTIRFLLLSLLISMCALGQSTNSNIRINYEKGYRVYLDEQLIGLTKADDTGMSFLAPEGKHEISIRKAGSKDLTFSMTIAANKMYQVDIENGAPVTKISDRNLETPATQRVAETQPERKTETQPERRTETQPESRTETQPMSRAVTQPMSRSETQPMSRTETPPEKRPGILPERRVEASISADGKLAARYMLLETGVYVCRDFLSLERRWFGNTLSPMHRWAYLCYSSNGNPWDVKGFPQAVVFLRDANTDSAMAYSFALNSEHYAKTGGTDGLLKNYAIGFPNFVEEFKAPKPDGARWHNVPDDFRLLPKDCRIRIDFRKDGLEMILLGTLSSDRHRLVVKIAPPQDESRPESEWESHVFEFVRCK